MIDWFHRVLSSCHFTLYALETYIPVLELANESISELGGSRTTQSYELQPKPKPKVL